MFLLILPTLFVLPLAYLWHANRAIVNEPPEFARLRQKDWTKKDVEDAYRKAQSSSLDVKPFLFSKKSRRYVVVGGSGLVGGWIVHHLIMRGEDPAAIRIIDLRATKRQEALDNHIDFVQTDVADPEAVAKAFSKPWPGRVKSLPLTVFHCVAYIAPNDRKPEFSSIYVKVNIVGTKNVLSSAKTAGASCFIATSSASVGLVPPSYFPRPWQRWPKDVYQFVPNAEPKNIGAPLEAFGSCYAWSKAQAEKMVCEANNPQAGFLTGSIRPGHAIYGHGVENTSSVTWDYLQRGGSPSWLWQVVAQFVNAQNVSIGHLAYEDTLLSGRHKGGKGYAVTDPNPPIRYGNLYMLLEQLAHPLKPVHFSVVPHIAMLLVSYVIEAYYRVRQRYLPFLPRFARDLELLQPAMFNMCTLHIVYTDTAAQEEIGYRAPIKTLDGFALALVDWNAKIEAEAAKKIEHGKGGEVQVQKPATIPKPPAVQ